MELELATSLAEIYRENNELELLVTHYHNIGNNELRDKYIDEALKDNPSDGSIIFLRSLQKRSDLIPKEVIEREINHRSKNQDWSQFARLYVQIGDYKKTLFVAHFVRPNPSGFTNSGNVIRNQLRDIKMFRTKEMKI